MQLVRTTLAFLIAAVAMSSKAQDSTATKPADMMIFGIITDKAGNDPMRNASVTLHTDSMAVDSVFTDPLGRYQIFIPLAGVHRLVYAMDGYHRKTVEVDANAEMDAATRAQEWNLRVDISLLRAEVPLPDELLDTPVGKAAWQAEMREFKWDGPYTDRYEQRFKQALKEAARK